VQTGLWSGIPPAQLRREVLPELHSLVSLETFGRFRSAEHCIKSRKIEGCEDLELFITQ
jgi:hypothetical protein